MARNGFRTAQYGKVRIREKGKVYQFFSVPDATSLYDCGRLRWNRDNQVGTAQRLVFSFFLYPNFAILRSPKAVSRHSDARIVTSGFENFPVPEMSAIRAPKKRRKMRCLCSFKLVVLAIHISIQT
ncbi:hypothetical protein L596_021389 [Steinernema carpocapsae]|uniref:Uncharacterized protein n=1 Tax=Steinernema carpocapsae TaxID=34508 RepID=A0A4V5ZZX0_STECR|nr:hypothetical protein L596_021389 [Steinernema carpocapsae]